MHIYDRLGVTRRVNGAGTLTRLGGGLMPPEVLAAMAEAADSAVDMAELQAAASRVIARATGAEAGIVTSGAAAALTLGTAACLTGFDAAKMDRLPDTAGMANEVIMSRTHRTGYDHAIRAAGARIVEVGFNDRAVGCGVRGVEPWEIAAAISPNTVAVAYAATPADDPPLAEVVAVADAHGLPVLVDAAAQLPPVENLRRFVEAGAALVAFSGGKAIRGPQASGLLCGRRDLVAAALLQQLDMDVAPETWSPPPELVPMDELRGLPHHGIGRGFKAGKEEIVGLLVALERFTAPATAAAELDRWEAWLTEIAGRLDDVPGVYARLLSVEETGGAPMLEVSLADGDAWALSRALHGGDPPIHLGEGRAGEGVLLVKPGALREGDAAVIAERLVELLAA